MSRLLRLTALLGIVAIASHGPAVAQEDPVERTVRLNGIDMYVEMHGAGEPLVLLHGFGGCAQTWDPFVDELAAYYRLIIPDLRAHGHSTGLAETFSHRQAASDVVALLDSLGIQRFKAMGISTGGMTLLHVATRQPERVGAMVLIGATYHFPEQAREMARELKRAMATDGAPGARAMFGECATRGEPQADSLLAKFISLKDSHDDMNLTADDLSAISVRTLIVHGDRDEFFPVEIPVEMYNAIPESELWIIPEGFHVPIFDPAVPFAATALRFLEKGEVARSLREAIDQDGPTALAATYDALKQRYAPEHFNEGMLNQVGYELLGIGRVEDAIAVFELNVEQYPDAWNPYDSLGDAYAAAGEIDKAMESYRRSLELNPDSPSARKLQKMVQR